jgi:phage-related minor tail protein
MIVEPISIEVKADSRHLKREFSEVERLAQGFGATMSRAFAGAIVSGRDFGDVLRSLALRLSGMAIGAAFKPIEQGFAQLLGGLLGGGAPGDAWADIRPQLNAMQTFASGGVIATPTYFPLGPSLGVAGERGAEAILPLARGADGKLGVRSQAQARPLAVTVNVSTPDAASFHRSEAYLSGVIARAVARGERNL